MPGFEGTKEQLEEIDPNQVTIHDVIDDAIESAEKANEALIEAEKAVVDILSPTEYETPEETLLKAANGSTIDELDAAEPMNEQEDELEMDDDTFEL